MDGFSRQYDQQVEENGAFNHMDLIARVQSNIRTIEWRPIDLVRLQKLNHRVVIVENGLIALSCEVADGRRAICCLFHDDDLIDIRLNDQCKDAELIALVESRLLVANERSFENQLAKDQQLAAWVRCQTLSHMARLTGHCMDLACKTPLERLASVILELHSWPQSQTHSQNCFPVPMRYAEIADYIGITPETLSRSFKQLCDEGLIQIEDRKFIMITSMSRLIRLAGGGRPRKSNGFGRKSA